MKYIKNQNMDNSLSDEEEDFSSTSNKEIESLED